MEGIRVLFGAQAYFRRVQMKRKTCHFVILFIFSKLWGNDIKAMLFQLVHSALIWCSAAMGIS